MGNIDTMTFVKIILGISLFAFVVSFWVLMIRDCKDNMEGFDRYKWFMILIVGNVIGALAYYILPRRKRKSEQGY